MSHPEKSLERLIANMEPLLHDGVYAFCGLPSHAPIPAHAIASFQEREGLTAIVPRKDADAMGLTSVYDAAWITLTIHSDLDAVGFLAAISAALAGAGISCNVVSAVYHDHLFVPAADGARAVEVLRGLSRSGLSRIQ